jgi:hypothetical protein
MPRSPRWPVPTLQTPRRTALARRHGGCGRWRRQPGVLGVTPAGVGSRQGAARGGRAAEHAAAVTVNQRPVGAARGEEVNGDGCSTAAHGHAATCAQVRRHTPVKSTLTLTEGEPPPGVLSQKIAPPATEQPPQW